MTVRDKTGTSGRGTPRVPPPGSSSLFPLQKVASGTTGPVTNGTTITLGPFTRTVGFVPQPAAVRPTTSSPGGIFGPDGDFAEGRFAWAYNTIDDDHYELIIRNGDGVPRAFDWAVYELQQ